MRILSHSIKAAATGIVAALFVFNTAAVPPVPPVLAATAEQAQEAEKEEVQERLELNAATVEQIVALGVVSADEAKKIVELRDQLGNLQSYEDLAEAGLSKETIDKLRPVTTVNYMATDCNC